MRACRSLPRIVAWHVLPRHVAPRHSPEALCSFRTTDSRAHVRPLSTSSPATPEGETTNKTTKNSVLMRREPSSGATPSIHSCSMPLKKTKKTHSLALLYFPLFRCKGTWRLPIAYAMERPRFAARPICVRDRAQTNSFSDRFPPG